MFPSRIPYTSMSLPYRIGNGWSGGVLLAIVAGNGNIYCGLWYPGVVAAGTMVIGVLVLPKIFRRNIDA